MTSKLIKLMKVTQGCFLSPCSEIACNNNMMFKNLKFLNEIYKMEHMKEHQSLFLRLFSSMVLTRKLPIKTNSSR